MQGPRLSDADELLRERHVVELEAMLPQYVSRVGWSARRLRDERLRALRALLVAATERSPWHRERLAPIDIGAFTEERIGEIPVMTKSDLMNNFDVIVTDRRLTRELCEQHLDRGGGGGAYLLGEHQIVASGGSSGQRGVYVYDRTAWAMCYASSIRFQARDWAADPTLVGVPRIIGVVAASNTTHISAAFSATFSTGRNARHLFPVSLPLEQIVNGLNELQPTVLMGYSSFLPRLAREARAGRLHIAPRRVVAISEPLLPETRDDVRTTWGAPVANGYAMSEGVFTGFCGHGIHLPDDLCLFEPVDVAGRAVAHGSRSQQVYVTNLYNHTLPLIRFEVSDEVTVLEGECVCGSTMRRIDDPQGRLDDTFVYDGAVTVHPHVFRSALGVPGILEYEVRQTPRGADIKVVIHNHIDRRRIERKIQKALAQLGVVHPEIVVEAVDSVPRQASGKLKRFVPLHT